MSTHQFAALGVAEPLLRALDAENYTDPTPIQAQAIPALLERRDILGIAQTGTGKTAAFAVPILQNLSHAQPAIRPKEARALILAPTRELAIQISDSFRAYGRFLGIRHTVVLGGVRQGPQVKAMSRGVDVLIATPGRLLDLVNQGHIKLHSTGVLVLDEADRMLDMGFINDIRKIIRLMPRDRQSLLFSATMPKEIAHLAEDVLDQPVRISVTPKVVAVDRIKQQVAFVPQGDKIAMLQEMLADSAMERVIVFTRTRHRANRVTTALGKSGVEAVAIHGDKSQNARQKALKAFKSGGARVLVATDIAARGIDVDNVTHVINFELPEEPESYVHRIGRTARAGAEGIAIAYVDATEIGRLTDIERLTNNDLEIIYGDRPAGKKPPARTGRGQRNGKGQSKGHGKGQNRDNQQQSGGKAKGQPDTTAYTNGGSGKPKRQKNKPAGTNPGARRRNQRNKSGNRKLRRAA